MGRPDEFGSLQTGEWGRIQELADRFERACQQSLATGTAVDLNTLLPGREDPLRRVALYELIKIDMEFRWRRGQIITLEHYLETYPELGPAEELSPRLIYEEYRLSQLNGVNTTLTVYQKRFPRQYEEVQKLIQEGHALTRAPNEAPPAPASPSGGAGIGSGLASANPLASGQDAGNIVGAGYKLERKIGSGAFGEVWRGKSRGGVEVAVKIIFRPLDNEEAKSELTAMELIKTLRHPFLLQTHDFWPEQDRLFIVMELGDCSLRDRLKACKKLGMTGIPAKELLAYFHQAAEAIDYLHGKRLLHRDLKPDNILLQEQYAKVADFGLARLMSTRRSAKMSSSGTPAYMAPEMWSSKPNQFSDQYCLATTYTELRQGKPPFRGQDIIQLMRAHLQDGPDLSGVGDREQQVLLRALDKEPENRFASCAAFVAALEAVVETGKVVRPEVTHVTTREPERPTPAAHPNLIHDDWPDDQTGTLRPGAARAPVLPPPELQPRSSEAADTDSGEFLTVAAAHAPAVPPAPSVRPRQDMPSAHPSQLTPRPPSWHSTDRAPSTMDVAVVPAAPSIRHASWKKTTPTLDRGKKKLLLSVGAGVAVLALVGFLFWNAGSGLQKVAADLVQAGKFKEALQQIDDASFLALPFARASARTQVLDAWRSHVKGLNHDEMEKAAGELLRRFPDDEQTIALLDSALQHNIPPLIEKEAFTPAGDRLAAVSQKSTVKGKLKEELRNKWLDRARKELAIGAYKAAKDTTRELLLYFKSDPDAEGLRRLARFQLVAIEVHKLKKEAKFDAALARLNAEAGDLDPQDVAKLKHDLEHARHDAFHALVEKAQEFLNGNKDAECLARLTEAEKLAGNDTDRATIQKLRIKAGSGPVAPLLEKAERALAKGEFADCQKTARQGLARLNEVLPLARKDVEQRFDTYLALAWARDPGRVDKQSDEMQQLFSNLLKQGLSPRLGELCREYVKMTKDRPRWSAQVQVLNGVLARLAPADRTFVENALAARAKVPPPVAYGKLLTEARGLYDRGDYAASHEMLGKIEETDLTDAPARNEKRALFALSAAALNRVEAPRLLMEAIAQGVTVRQDQLSLALAKLALEQSSVRSGAVTLLARVLPGLSPSADRAKVDCYLAYLNGLKNRDADQFEDAAGDMLRAYAVAIDALSTPDRAAAAADVFSKAAEALPRGDDPLAPFPNRADADKVYQWLEKAQALLAAQQKELPAAARVKLALAANFKTTPDLKLARELADRLMKDGEVELPLLLVRAQAQENPDQRIAAYADILKRSKKQDRLKVAPREWFVAVLQPAVTVADRLPAATPRSATLKAELARCYASYGRFVREHLYEDWIPKNAKQVAFNAYGKAVELNGTNPEYWIGRAYSGTALKVDWTEVRKDADKALELGPNNAAAYGLLGYVNLLQSRRDGEVDRKKQLAALHAADAALATAMKLAKRDEEDRAVFLLNRSITCLELGNYLAAHQTEKRKEYLYAARDYAAQAADLSPAYPELVQEAWGNALEDIALFVEEKASEAYPQAKKKASEAYSQAVEKFTAAITLQRLETRFYVDRGRTQYRWAVLEKKADANRLTNAMEDLETAINGSSLSRDMAEAYYWEGMIFHKRHKPKEARAAFAKAINIGYKHDGREWMRATLVAAQALVPRQAEDVIKLADEAAQLVEQDKNVQARTEAARLLIDIYRLKADACLHQAKLARGEAWTKAHAMVEAAAAKIQEYGDVPQAAYVRGRSYENAHKLPEALKAYNAGLADARDPTTPVHGLLLLHRATVQVDLNTTKWKSISPTAREKMLKELWTALEVVPDDTNKAAALSEIACIHSLAAAEIRAPAEELMNAITSGRKALKYWKKTDPEGAKTRSLLALNLLIQARKTPGANAKLKYLNEGIEQVREGLQMENLPAEVLRNLRAADDILRKDKKKVEEGLGGGG